MGPVHLDLNGEKVFTTPSQNLAAANTTLELIEPSLLNAGVDLTPHFSKLKAYLMAAAAQENDTPSSSRRPSASDMSHSASSLRARQHRVAQTDGRTLDFNHEERRHDDRSGGHHRRTPPRRSPPRENGIVQYHQRHPDSDLRHAIPHRDARYDIIERQRERDRSDRRRAEDEQRRAGYYDDRPRHSRNNLSAAEWDRMYEGPSSYGGVRAYSEDLRSVRWPQHFKPTPLDKYDGKTNPTDWLHLYSTSIQATGGDTFVMANYLPVCLSNSARTWLYSLPANSIHTWGELCRTFVRNFEATCNQPDSH